MDRIRQKGLGALRPAYDSDAQAYFNQLTGTIPISFKQAVNTFVLALKAASIWTELDRLWIHATPNQQNARVSLINPTSTNITEVNGPTWIANLGYAGDGATAYLNTNYNTRTDSIKYTQSNAGIFYYSRTNLDQLSCDWGVLDGSNESAIAIRNTNVALSVLNDGPPWPGIAIANLNSDGFFVSKRTGVVSTSLSRNGTSLITGPGFQGNTPNAKLFLLCLNSSGSAVYNSSRQISLSGVGSGNYSDAAFNTAVQNLKTAIGF